MAAHDCRGPEQPAASLGGFLKPDQQQFGLGSIKVDRRPFS
jgi:hypothetical protein